MTRQEQIIHKRRHENDLKYIKKDVQTHSILKKCKLNTCQVAKIKEYATHSFGKAVEEQVLIYFW